MNLLLYCSFVFCESSTFTEAPCAVLTLLARDVVITSAQQKQSGFMRSCDSCLHLCWRSAWVSQTTLLWQLVHCHSQRTLLLLLLVLHDRGTQPSTAHDGLSTAQHSTAQRTGVTQALRLPLPARPRMTPPTTPLTTATTASGCSRAKLHTPCTILPRKPLHQSKADDICLSCMRI